jgi:(1->4)-alpha-D-glucan 1-alpha-D-glucosylmutase
MEGISCLRIPVATYRLQFNYRFTFSDAVRLVSYLSDLGISDIYASPCFEAGKQSTHGYDIVDPNTVSSELGGQQVFDRYVKVLHQHGMGLILDIVPNHMNVESDKNAWWMDVLENGPSSVHAETFDIDWVPVKRELHNKVLIPILGEQYGAALEGRELRLAFEKGAFFLRYHDHILPILPETYAIVLSHRIDETGLTLGANHPHLAELVSIITALTCLPSYTEREPTRITDRHREKEIIKQRLRTLCKKSPAVREFIDSNVFEYNGTKDDPRSYNLLDDLLSKQVWRLSYWRVATEEINYRRFFDVNSLAAIRMENPEVYRKTHGLIFRLIWEGKVTGLRVDHPDGLYDPCGYFKELQKDCFYETRRGRINRQDPSLPADETGVTAAIRREYEGALASDPQFKPFYIVGEKILTKNERVPGDWPIFSTIGYVFLNPLNGIFVETAHRKAFDSIYGSFIGSKMKYRDLVYDRKKLIMLTSMSGEINSLGQYLNGISEKNRHTRDFTLNTVRTAITEVIACFPVYRTYITAAGVNKRDVHYVGSAVSEARQRNPGLSATAFDFLEKVLLLRHPEDVKEADRAEWVDFVMKFQQVTGPVMAKGLEDTAFYIFNRLMSLNEVGGNPEEFGTTLDTFHRQNMETATERPHSLITTTTHDTKRSEDARARLDVLSEIPDEWRSHLAKWSRLNRKKKLAVDSRVVPDRNEEYLLYQTLVAVWPVFGLDQVGYEAFKTRITAYMVKAVREAKINSSWISPNLPYEEAVLRFTDSVLSRPAVSPFLKDFVALEDRVSYLGMFNSLSQTLLKITSPGVPDFYQGCEMWDFSLVDPDNRRPVDFGRRQHVLKRLLNRIAMCGEDRTGIIKELLAKWQTGAIKLYLTSAALNYRKKHVSLFKDGGYVPLMSDGRCKENVCAFARYGGDSNVLTVVPRFLTHLVRGVGEAPLGAKVWEDSWIIIPDEMPFTLFRNVLTGQKVAVVEREGGRALPLGEVFASFPVALLEGLKSLSPRETRLGKPGRPKEIDEKVAVGVTEGAGQDV